MKTNKEMLATLSNERWYEVVDWLFYKYGRNFTDTRGAVLQWLDRYDIAEGVLDQIKEASEFNLWTGR